MGGDQVSANESTRKMMKSLARYAPDAIAAIARTTPDTAMQELAAEQATAPGYAALQNQIYRDYGPEANRLGNEQALVNALAAAEAERQVATGPGAGSVAAARQLQETLDPEYFANRALIGDALGEYLKAYSPTELTGSEIAQINRGIAAQEGPLTPSALRTVKNAQTFGNAATQRWQNFGNAVTTASSALPTLKSGITGFEVATRRPLVSNTGEARLSSPVMLDATSALGANFGLANTALGEMGALQRGQQARARSTLDKVIGGTQAAGNVLSGVGALI